MRCVYGYNYFTGLDRFGTNTDGTCSYLTAAMLLGYYQRYCALPGTLVPNRFIYDYCNTKGRFWGLTNGLHTWLVSIGKSLGFGNSTESGAIRDTIDAYLKERRIYRSNYYKEAWIPWIGNADITSSLDKDNPVIWFGLVTSCGNWQKEKIEETFHAVVVYGYRLGVVAPEYIAHFGWPDCMETYFTGVLGSMYAFTTDNW